VTVVAVIPIKKNTTPSEGRFFLFGSPPLGSPVHSDFKEAMSMEKRYFTSDLSSRS
jgi:hypothetical protein